MLWRNLLLEAAVFPLSTEEFALLPLALHQHVNTWVESAECKQCQTGFLPHERAETLLNRVVLNELKEIFKAKGRSIPEGNKEAVALAAISLLKGNPLLPDERQKFSRALLLWQDFHNSQFNLEEFLNGRNRLTLLAVTFDGGVEEMIFSGERVVQVLQSGNYAYAFLGSGIFQNKPFPDIGSVIRIFRMFHKNDPTPVELIFLYDVIASSNHFVDYFEAVNILDNPNHLNNKYDFILLSIPIN